MQRELVLVVYMAMLTPPKCSPMGLVMVDLHGHVAYLVNPGCLNYSWPLGVGWPVQCSDAIVDALNTVD